MNIKQNLKYQQTLVATIVLAVVLFITGTNSQKWW